jgi:VanZ family protein
MNFLKYQFPPVLWIIVIYSLSAIPNLQQLFRFPLGVDKLAHAVFYFVLCWLVWRAFRQQHAFPIMRNGALLGAFIFSVAFCSLDEYHQMFVPGRNSDFNDVIAAAGGALLFVAIASLRRYHSDAGKEKPES